ncbi:MAG: phage terminase small subunit P27 family [Candidatus Acidiferrales bacterium]
MPKGSGRRPLPTSLKKLRGNAGKRKLNNAEPRPEPGQPEMLEHLGPIAQSQWRRVVPLLLKLGVLSKLDQAALCGYCAAFERWVLAERDVLKFGLTIQEPVINLKTGKQRTLGRRRIFRLKKNPAISTANDAMKLMKSFLIEFGMTPAALTRLRVEPAKEHDDPFDALIKGRFANPEQKYAN